MSAPTMETPAYEAIDGAALLEEIHAQFGRYVVFSSPEAHDAVVLWVGATHGQVAWEHAPRLAIVSPEKRCGKSRLMDIAEALCHQALITVNASTAAIVRSITEHDPPTLMVDEADTIFGNKKTAEANEDVRGILNAGHQRNRPYLRWSMEARKQENCPTFAMAMLASIGNLPDTIMDRAVVIHMRRRGKGESVAPFRTRRDGEPLRELQAKLHVWMQQNIGHLREHVPTMPVEDRDADTWEPLFAVAALAGGDWSSRAARACLTLTGEDNGDDRLSTQLLGDIKAVWVEGKDHLFTTTLITKLCEIDESPWKTWGRKGDGIDARMLGHFLKPYGIKPKTVKQAPGKTAPTAKGYSRADFEDAWSRYVPDPEPEPEPQTLATVLRMAEEAA
jgi:hypothetical protein